MLLTLYSIIRTTMAEQVMSGGTLPCHATMALLPIRMTRTPLNSILISVCFCSVTDPALDSCRLVPVRGVNPWLWELHLSYDPPTLQGGFRDYSVPVPWASDWLPVKWDCTQHRFLLCTGPKKAA